MIRLITFDLDETLWGGTEVVLRAENEMINWVSDKVPNFSEQYRIHAADIRAETLVKRPRIHYDFNKIRVAVVEHILQKCGLQPGEASEIASAALCIFHGFRNELQLNQDAVAILRELQEHYLLASISNGTSEVHRSPLKNFFELSVYARNMGTRKPDPAMFQVVLSHTKTLPQQAIHVGDHPIEDLEVAKRVGMYTIQYFTGQYAHSPHADKVVDQLADVVLAVQAINESAVKNQS
ncbi:MAG: HAD family hydrolase [Gammaproteobacteria bacterium]|nr:HAD family hydrolase [Gammaproteobacteria bacterium]